MPDNPATSVALGLGVYRVTDGPLTRIVATDVAALTAAVGESLMICVARAFVGAERVEAIQHLLFWNRGAGAGSVGHERNRRLLVLMMYGFMDELEDALTGLVPVVNQSGVLERIDDLGDWRALEAMRTRWRTNKLAGKIRSQLAFHLGDDATYRRGLREWGSEPLTLFVQDSRDTPPFTMNSAVVFGQELFGRGLSWDEDELQAFARQAQEDHQSIADHLDGFWGQILRSVGVGVSATP